MRVDIYNCIVQCEQDKGTAFGMTLLPIGKKACYSVRNTRGLGRCLNCAGN